MFEVEDLTSLIAILQEYIKTIKQQLNKIKTIEDSKINKEKELLESLSNNSQTIYNIDFNILIEILNELEIDEENKNTIHRHLEIIQKIVKANQENGSTIGIPEKLLKTFNQFINYWKKAQETIKSTLAKNNVPELKEKLQSYQTIIERIENRDFLTESDIEIIDSLFENKGLSFSTKTNILLGVIRYNSKVSNKHFGTITRNSILSIDDIDKILKNYGYHFSQLSQNLQNELLENGNLENINSVLESLKNHNFPGLNLEKDGEKFVLLLLRSSKETIDRNIIVAREHDFFPRDLLKIFLSLIDPKHQEKREQRPGSKRGPHTTNSISGASKDFVSNLEYLSSIGISKETIKKNPAVLVVSHKSLKNRIELLKKYGIDISKPKNPALSGLLSNGIETLDQFIEASPKGLEYIKDNLSSLTCYDINDAALYRIYYSHKIGEGPFSTQRGENLSLRGEISGRNYRGILYKGITEENKLEATGTIKVVTDNQSIFDECLAKRSLKDKSVDEILYEDETLQKLAEYINPNRPYAYDFDGITVSRYKVARVYNTLKANNLHNKEDALLYAVTYNLIINQDDYEKLKGIIKGWRK